MTATASELKEVEEALAKLPGSEFFEAATGLLNTLGYKSDLIPPDIQSNSVDDFIRQYGAKTPDTKTKQLFKESVKSIRILFQFTDQEITAQGSLFNTANFNTSKAQSFLFVAVELKDGNYPRGKYASFAREVNKCWPIPTIVLFWTSEDLLTLAFVQHRPHKRKPRRDVLDKVSLIREIRPADPHRAHLEILTELGLKKRLKWMVKYRKNRDFDGLMAAWLDALDTEALNRDFYNKLLAWFKCAEKKARFPTTGAIVHSPQEHVIRLITRLLFIWFIKEKGLIAEDLFIEDRVRELLKNYDSEKDDSYYRAVLQNLFFATLNTEINRRRFSKKSNTTHRDFSRYRYASEIADTAQLMELFAKTPFINGGLFDCLDSFEATGDGGFRIDCFTDNPAHRHEYSIPNNLFFGDEGLITLFNCYKFTVEENTPAEQEVALDPELLGKVFEKLLAATTLKTKKSARKQTGSYYTPRTVVDYMVDEALVATLVQKIAPGDAERQWWVDRLHYLFDYNDAGELFYPAETNRVVQAIAELRVLDPAVGSGAFPMGVLHKLTLALRRLDPKNNLWQELQKERALLRTAAAFDTANTKQARDEELAGISETFERYRDSDFGRKLYLIQNSIYGVDIQPVAIQIAKLRFFISLAIEQQPTDDKNNNYGIHPLPNLETRFVAADTLLGLGQATQIPLGGRNEVTNLNDQLRQNREDHFNASHRPKKLHLHRQAAWLRKELEKELEKAGMPESDARKVADWDPYDQNVGMAKWFDAGYMFNVHNGFDIVIGNPPYVRSEGSGQHRKMRNRLANSGQYKTLHEKWDLYIPFIERGYKLLNPGGFTTMIVSDAYCHARYAKKSREWFLKNGRVVRLDFLGRIQIFEAGVHNIVYLFQKADGQKNKPERRVHYPKFGSIKLLPTDEQRNLTDRAFFPEDVQSNTISALTIPLEKICYISYGLRPSSKPGTSDQFKTADLIVNAKDKIHSKPYVDGKHLDVWLPKTNLWIEWGTVRSPSQFYAPTFPQLHDVSEKIIAKRTCGAKIKVCYDDQQLVFTASSVGILSWHSLAGIQNDSIRKQARYRNEKQLRRLPPRETLEQLSRRFSMRFLLAVLNSTFVANFLRANRRHNLHLYPNDWKNIPIPDVPKEDQEPIIQIVDRILSAKVDNPVADTSADEEEINQLVYDLYGLTEEGDQNGGG